MFEADWSTERLNLLIRLEEMCVLFVSMTARN